MSEDIIITTEDKDYIASRVRGLLFDFSELGFTDDITRHLNATKRVMELLNGQDSIQAAVFDISLDVAHVFNHETIGVFVHLSLHDTVNKILIKPHFNHRGRFQEGLHIYIAREDENTFVYETVRNLDGVLKKNKKLKMNFDTEEGRAKFFDFIADQIIAKRRDQHFERAMLDAVNPAPKSKSKMPPQNKFKI